MLLNDVINIVQNKNWTRINNFFIDIFFEPGTKSTIKNEGQSVKANSYGPIDFARMCGWNQISKDDLNAALIGVTTPEYQNALINEYVSYEWRYHQGRDQLYRFTMIFRDFDQMTLYNTFRTLYTKSKEQYFDKIKMNIKVYLDSDFGVESMPIFQTSEAIIESMSQLQFSNNTENQIAEFSINFVCNTVVVGGETKQFTGIPL